MQQRGGGGGGCRVAAVKAVVTIGGITAGGRLVVRPLYRRISVLKNSDVFAATTLLMVLGTSVLTQAAGLSLALGAFLVGAPLAAPPPSCAAPLTPPIRAASPFALHRAFLALRRSRFSTAPDNKRCPHAYV